MRERATSTETAYRFVGTLLRVHRERAGISESELAERAGLTRRVIRRVEAGGDVTVEMLGKLLTVIGPQASKGLLLVLMMPEWSRRALAACSRLDADLLHAAKQLSDLLGQHDVEDE